MIAPLKNAFRRMVHAAAVRRVHHYTASVSGVSASVRSPEGISFRVYRDIPVDLRHPFQNNLHEAGTAGVFAYAGDELIGCFFFNPSGRAVLRYPFRYTRICASRAAYVHGLYVKPHYRGKGIGTALYRQVIRAVASTHTRIDAYVDESVLTARQTAERAGLQFAGDLYLLKIARLQKSFYFLRGIPASAACAGLGALKGIAKTGRILFFPAVEKAKKGYARVQDRALGVYEISGEDHAPRIRFLSKGVYDVSLFRRMYARGYTVKELKKFPRRALREEYVRACADADVVIADAPYSLLTRALGNVPRLTFIPQWVVQRIHAPFPHEGFKKVRKCKNRSAYYDVRSVQKRGYRYEFVKNKELLRFFYDHMYLPHIRQRFSEETVIKPFAELRRVMRRGGLFLIKDGNRYVSGAVIECVRRVFHPMFLGVLNGDRGLVKRDALSALYYFYFRYAAEHGFHTIDLGLSRPFLNDGILQYKAKWDAVISFDPCRANVFAIRVRRFTPPVKRFLLNNPLMSLRRKQLYGHIWIEPGQNYRQDILKGYRYRGLAGLKIHALGTEHADDLGGVGHASAHAV
ncbi:MAG: GNAT family N-acetyltransferase [Candidatus Omnitrophica bacterium]|nr:GNAT family N-acetyltransferase [Candidatus Omnitrophota bacterium]